ncbi:unnamed protein product [Schistosoma curassoni]|uniref:protein-tyrosine-phosphatase n=1 Tax=Schistosoma curassoni TaxID=6186 RepID=A0A183L2B2_9TREM|nr:unnamed protein product [Schistosoma curassoni]
MKQRHFLCRLSTGRLGDMAQNWSQWRRCIHSVFPEESTNYFKFHFIQTNEAHHVLHMQYTNWPDFGIPNSPGAILNFLWSVRASGALNDPCYPPVIHCSAGIGRSGTFVLIDLALILVS